MAEKIVSSHKAVVETSRSFQRPWPKTMGMGFRVLGVLRSSLRRESWSLGMG